MKLRASSYGALFTEQTGRNRENILLHTHTHIHSLPFEHRRTHTLYPLSTDNYTATQQNREQHEEIRSRSAGVQNTDTITRCKNEHTHTQKRTQKRVTDDWSIKPQNREVSKERCEAPNKAEQQQEEREAAGLMEAEIKEYKPTNTGRGSQGRVFLSSSSHAVF